MGKGRAEAASGETEGRGCRSEAVKEQKQLGEETGERGDRGSRSQRREAGGVEAVWGATVVVPAQPWG